MEQKETNGRQGPEDKAGQEAKDHVSGLVPALRQGVMVLQMVFYMKLKEKLGKTEPRMDEEDVRLFAGAVVNRYFGETEPSEQLRNFLNDNEERVEQVLCRVAEEMEDLRIPLTDALRMHFFLNRFEKTGDEEAEAEALKRAKDWGILIEDRQVPWPRGFMEMAYRVGKAYGLLREQEPQQQGAGLSPEKD